jgi:hypothetical protein
MCRALARWSRCANPRTAARTVLPSPHFESSPTAEELFTVRHLSVVDASHAPSNLQVPRDGPITRAAPPSQRTDRPVAIPPYSYYRGNRGRNKGRKAKSGGISRWSWRNLRHSSSRRRACLGSKYDRRRAANRSPQPYLTHSAYAIGSLVHRCLAMAS